MRRLNPLPKESHLIPFTPASLDPDYFLCSTSLYEMLHVCVFIGLMCIMLCFHCSLLNHQNLQQCWAQQGII